MKVVGVELRAGGGHHRTEKPGWSARDMEKQPGNVNEEHQQMTTK